MLLPLTVTGLYTCALSHFTRHSSGAQLCYPLPQSCIPSIWITHDRVCAQGQFIRLVRLDGNL